MGGLGCELAKLELRSTINHPQTGKYVQIKMFLQDTLFKIGGR